MPRIYPDGQCEPDNTVGSLEIARYALSSVKSHELKQINPDLMVDPKAAGNILAPLASQSHPRCSHTPRHPKNLRFTINSDTPSGTISFHA